MNSSPTQRIELPLAGVPGAEAALEQPDKPVTADQETTPPVASLEPAQVQEVMEKIEATLRTCYDPEIPVNIWELGLIYHVDVEPTGAVKVRMTLTSPACPAAGSLPPEVKHKVEEIAGVNGAQVDVVWDPPWDPSRMSEAARLQLGLYDY